MTLLFEIEDYNDWRSIAKQLVASDVAPHEVALQSKTATPLLLPPNTVEDLPAKAASSVLNVPRQFVSLAETASFHSESDRWNLLYRMLWRISRGEKHLLELTTDDDVRRLKVFEKQVRRDCHKMKAFVRFRKLHDSDGERYVAWHRPDHPIVKRVAPFFSRRFRGMRWTIFTPLESADWDGERLAFGEGIAKSEAPADDDLEEFWKTYYGATFNPARIKIAMMKSEMPVRHWATLPEAAIIDDLLEEAPERVEKMLKHVEGLDVNAADFLPQVETVEELRKAAAECRGCSLCESATQTVFGFGPNDARMVIVGEQPGDQEDIIGKPFVGPAGQLLRKICSDAGTSMEEHYVTNAVKHFSFQQRGKQRLHKKPSSREVQACKPWLAEELSIIQPDVLLCLGATALQSVVGRHVRLSEIRGEIFETAFCEKTIASWHPSAILRSTPEQAERKTAELTSDLQLAVSSSKSNY